MQNKIYNIPASCSFADTLAKLFIEEYKNSILELADVIFLLPNRRACKTLKDAFIRVHGLKPLILPKIISIGDIEEDEIFITGFDTDLEELSPAIERIERILLFVKIIMAKPKEFGLENMNTRQATFLANELADLIDMANYENLSFSGLKNLVPEEYAVHWQETLKFLEIITRYWPEILKERNLIDPSLRYNQLLKAQSKIWKEKNTDKRIVVAGMAANFPAIKELIKTVISLPNGEFYINGLDKNLEDEAWKIIDEAHSQNEIKLLLKDLGISRFEIRDVVSSENAEREILISEIMRPAKITDKWREIRNKKLSHLAWEGISIVTADNSREEALSIALIMRETLETPFKTAALVTGDRNLARRVAVELERWDIKVDDSAGRPLSLTPIGIFLRLLIKSVESNFKPVDLLSLLKHPFISSDLKKTIRDYEYYILRSSTENEEIEKLIGEIKDRLKELECLMRLSKVSLKDLIKAHMDAAKSFVPDEILWRGEAGEAASRFISGFYEKADSLGEIKPSEYIGLLEALMVSNTVRSTFGTHPRLQILGPIEARFSNFDTVIIGGVVDGIWPKLSSADPWLSRPMKKDFGFPLPEKNIGIMAKDFSDLLANREVYITYSAKVDGTPMIKSRWLMRLETVISALGIRIEKLENNIFKYWVRALDNVEKYKKIAPPEPMPPVYSRPRKLSASGIESLIRDPYIVFAKYILKLKPLDDLDRDLTAADYGNIIHGILDEFNNKYPADLPLNAKEEMLNLGEKYFKKHEVALETKAFWWPKFEKITDWLIEQEKEYRKDILKIHSEVEGSMELDAPAGKFIITAKADRVDETKLGKINIIDYKTGQIKKIREVKAGYAPQLPIEGLIALNGGFKDVPAKDIEKLVYWKLADKEVIIDENIDEILMQNLENIKELIALFDFSTTAYISKPNSKYVTANRDYEHLARIKEWSIVGGDDE